MHRHEIYLAVFAIAIVGMDIFVRLHRARDRRDWFYKSLLEMKAGLSQRASASTPSAQADDSISHALLEFFRQSFTSQQVMTALAGSPNGMDGRQLEQHVVGHVSENWNRDLSINAIRRVVMILVGAKIVDVQDDKFALTDLGWTLVRRTRKPSERRWTEVRSGSLLPAQ